MKERLSYVSNSSSSSFICEDCGRVECGYDLSLEEAEMVECENGHVTCQDHRDTNIYDIDIVKRYLRSVLDRIGESDSIENMLKVLDKCNDIDIRNCAEIDIGEYTELFECYGYPKETCSICMLDVLKDSEGIEYLMKKEKVTPKDILEEVRNKFGTYEKFKEWLGESSHEDTK